MPLQLNRILLVDDDRVTNLMHRRVIQRCGLAQRIDEAADGLAALDFLTALAAAQEDFPQLILLDINMPRMNGFEFLEAFGRLAVRPVPAPMIVVLSTSMLPDDIQRARRNPHVFCFAEKPIGAPQLAAFVENYHQLHA